MKRIIPLLLLLLSSCCCNGGDTNTTAVGDWSKVVGGLRARLFVSAERGKSRSATVHLEFQNVSDVINPMELYLDLDHALDCQLLDDSGKPPPPPGMIIVSGPVVGPYWLLLPFDSSLTFRAENMIATAVPGPGQSGGLSIAIGEKTWLIPDNSRIDYFLSGTFSIPPPQEAVHDHLLAWGGVLKLPRVKIAAPSPKP